MVLKFIRNIVFTNQNDIIVNFDIVNQLIVQDFIHLNSVINK